MYQDKRKEQADKMNYFDCHVDTLTEILKPGDTLDENSCNLDLKRVGNFVENYTQIFAIWKQAEHTAGDAKKGAEIVFHIGDEGIRTRQANSKGEISWDKLVKVKKIAGIYVLYLDRDKAYLMPKRVFRGSEEQIFLSMLTRNLPQEKRRGIRA